MSAIVGVALTAEAEESSSSTTCRYRPAQGGGLVQVEVNWGAGEAAMTGVSIVSRLEPGIAEALAGVGDQAAAVGPALMIRTGEDLITLTFFDVDPAPAVIRRIVGTMRPRMGPRAQPG
jgi:hypothetical protein